MPFIANILKNKADWITLEYLAISLQFHSVPTFVSQKRCGEGKRVIYFRAFHGELEN
jgi:hypothetical protein